MDKKKLKEFFQWFLEIKPYCIEELMQLIGNTPGFESWEADGSPESLESLGEWFAKKVSKRDYTPEEVDFIKNRFDTHPKIEFLKWDLTDEAKSLALYVGIYYGDVVLKNNTSLKWEQCLGSKKYADYGQPVLNGQGFVSINPVRVAHSVAFGLINGTKTEGDLRKGYDYWRNLRMPI